MIAAVVAAPGGAGTMLYGRYVVTVGSSFLHDALIDDDVFDSIAAELPPLETLLPLLITLFSAFSGRSGSLWTNFSLFS